MATSYYFTVDDSRVKNCSISSQCVTIQNTLVTNTVLDRTKYLWLNVADHFNIVSTVKVRKCISALVSGLGSLYLEIKARTLLVKISENFIIKGRVDNLVITNPYGLSTEKICGVLKDLKYKSLSMVSVGDFDVLSSRVVKKTLE